MNDRLNVKEQITEYEIDTQCSTVDFQQYMTMISLSKVIVAAMIFLHAVWLT